MKVCWVEVVEEEKGEESLDMEEKGEESLAMDELEESPGIKMFVQADILSGLRLSSTEKTFFKSSWHYNIYFLCVTLVLLILMYTLYRYRFFHWECCIRNTRNLPLLLAA